jgi:hypothetical protein
MVVSSGAVDEEEAAAAALLLLLLLDSPWWVMAARWLWRAAKSRSSMGSRVLVVLGVEGGE